MDEFESSERPAEKAGEHAAEGAKDMKSAVSAKAEEILTAAQTKAETVGYGDIIPSTVQGKLLAMCTALLGATHGVTFVALVLQALTQHPPAKNQE